VIQLILISILLTAAAGVSGSAVWAFKKNAVDACHARWQADIARANLAVEQANQEKDDAVERVQAAARRDVEQARRTLEEAQQIFDETLAATKLGDACDKCRLPESVIWGLRAAKGNPVGQPSTTSSSTKGGSRSDDATGKGGVLKEGVREGIHRPGAPKSKELRGGTEKVD